MTAFMNSGPLKSTLVPCLWLIKQRNHQQKAQKCQTQGTKWTPERILTCSQQNLASSDLQRVLRGTHPHCFANVTQKHFRIDLGFQIYNIYFIYKCKQAGEFKYRVCNCEDPTPCSFQSPVPNFLLILPVCNTK